jgi:hypothetical protein
LLSMICSPFNMFLPSVLGWSFIASKVLVEFLCCLLFFYMLLGRSQPGPVKPSLGLPHQIRCHPDRECFPIFVGSGPLSRRSIKSQARHTNRRSSVNLGNPKRSDLLSAVSDRKPLLPCATTAAILTYAPPPELLMTAGSIAMSSSSSKTEGMI